MSQPKLLNTLVIPLRWMDLDAYGHVGNSRFFDFMTDARVDLMGAENVFADLSVQYVVVDAQCSFKKSTHYPGNLTLKQFCENIGNRSFTLLYQFTMEDQPETICAEGRLVMVCYDAKEDKAIALPEAVKKLLQ
jgi:acyl-CoA thioester hydrolase